MARRSDPSTTLDGRRAHGDLAAVRVATYLEADRPRVVRALKTAFSGPMVDGRPKRVHVEHKDVRKVRSEAEHYRAYHVQAHLRARDLAHPFQNLNGLSCEVQVCSMLAHVWNEIAHDIVYKRPMGEPSTTELALIRKLAELTLSGDKAITQLIQLAEARQRGHLGTFSDAFDFVIKVGPHFPELKELGAHAEALLAVLRDRDLATTEAVVQVMCASPPQDPRIPADAVAFHRARLHAFSDWMTRSKRQISKPLDDNSSDVVLMAVLAHVNEKMDPNRYQRRLRALALRYCQWQQTT